MTATTSPDPLIEATEPYSPPASRPRRRFLPRLPAPVWLVLAADATSAVGSGMTMPFLFIYLHNVRGISLGVAGLVAATFAAVSLIGNPLGGVLADRYGPRTTLIGGLILAAAGTAALPAVRTPAHAFAAAAVVGLGVSTLLPAQDTLLAHLVPAEQRAAAFTVRYAVMNAGLGAGALIAAVLIDPRQPWTFTVAYTLDAATFLTFVPALLLGLPRRRTDPPSENPAAVPAGPKAGYRAVLADRAFCRVWLLTAATAVLTYGQFHSTFPAFASEVGGVGTGVLGFAFAANTVVVVIAAPVTLHALAGRRRVRGIALAAAGFAATWAVTLASVHANSPRTTAAGLIAAMALFALAESVLAPTLPTLTNELADHADPDLRGRYNGAALLAWTTGFLLGPAIAGQFLDAGHGDTFVLLLAAGCTALAATTHRLDRHLPDNARRVNA